MSKLQDLRELIKSELNKAKQHYEKTKQSANEISRTAAASPSQSGDREHSTNQAFITKDRLNNLEKVIDELEKVGNSKTLEKVTPPIYLKIELQGQEQEFYLLSTPLHLYGVKIVSVNSPLGQAVRNKKVGEDFEYTAGGNKTKGMILEIVI